MSMGEHTKPVVFRPVRKDDADSVWLLLNAGRDDTVGMTSLPASFEATVARCAESAAVVTQLATGEFELPTETSATILMAAFDPDSGQALGTAGMTFKNEVQNLALQVTTSMDGLGLTMRSSSEIWTRTELNAIYLGPYGRGRRLGTVLSRGRLLFLHLIRSQVPTTVAAHLRGRFDAQGQALFWDRFCGQFCTWATSTEAEMALERSPELVSELADRVLPLQAEDLQTLGLVNRQSLTAFRMLTHEGLLSNGMYDPVDGGPTVSGELSDTRTSRDRVHGRVVLDPLDPQSQRSGLKLSPTFDALVSVPAVANFGVVRAQAQINDRGGIHLATATADALGITSDSLVTVLPLGEVK